MKIQVALVSLALLLSACAAAAGATIDGRTFLSTAVTQAGADRPLVPGTRIRLFFGADKNLSTSAGCNTIGGTYRIEGSSLVFEGGGMTEMGCDDPRHAQDDWLSAFLGSRPTITLAGNDLTLAAGDVVVRLLDREIAEPDLALVGPTWTLVSILSGETVSSIPGGVVATLKFGADGTVDVATGCNVGSGKATVEGDIIRISNLLLTKRACDATTAQVEGAVLAVIGAEGAAVSFEIDAASLSLSAGAGGLQLSGA
jgi:heat shock protein HslJ